MAGTPAVNVRWNVNSLTSIWFSRFSEVVSVEVNSPWRVAVVRSPYSVRVSAPRVVTFGVIVNVFSTLPE